MSRRRLLAMPSGKNHHSLQHFTLFILLLLYTMRVILIIWSR